MLEVINLTKTYSTKGGATVNALDGVTLRFPEKGMVFLLGKSGSGKSTLLNVCGGLDTPSGGEIIVKGRSSRDFTQGDFDSYRNTYVGFIFQEYNILNEFSVEDNIALALELQGKPKDRFAIDKLLHEVDLAGYGRRKPNTLSGGQKQRIAIARALVKNPEIIMADEPTGALDSNTGRQVFDTLKKLSREKLVLVVSHDRDFAEQYADRIIELADGHVISDISKDEVEKSELGSNVSVIGDNVLCVSGGEELSDDDFEHIKKFLGGRKNAIICTDEKDLERVRKVTRINDSGTKEIFRDSEQPEKKSYTKEESRFIRSKLPARHAFKIGASGLKTKPIRLIFTSLLCTVAFIFFGLLSTMMLYNGDAVYTESMMNSSYSLITINKGFTVNCKYYVGGELFDEYEYTTGTNFTAEEVEAFAKEYGLETFGAISAMTNIDNITPSSKQNFYYSGSITGIANLRDDNTLRNRITTGSYPADTEEILISSYTAESILELGLKNPETDTAYDISSESDIIGKKVRLSGRIFTVSGILECDPISSKFDSLKDGTNTDWMLTYEFQHELASGIWQVVFLHEDAIADMTSVSDNVYYIFSHSGSLGYPVIEDPTVLGSAMYYSMQYGSFGDAEAYFDFAFIDKDKTSLSNDEMLVNSSQFIEYFENYLRLNDYEAYNEWCAPDIDSESGMTYPALYEKLQYALGFFEFDTRFDGMEKDACLAEALAFINEKTGGYIAFDAGLYSYETEGLIAGSEFDGRIVGFFQNSEIQYTAAILSDSKVRELDGKMNEYYASLNYGFTVEESEYKAPAGAIYSAIYLEYDRSAEATAKIKDYVGGNKFDDGSVIHANNALIDQINSTNIMVETLSQVFLYVGLVFAVFAALLLSNFISVSISQKTREIGILRAVGARSIDVFKIFFSEAFIISAICVLFSIVGGVTVCSVLNAEVSDLMGGVSLFVFGPLSILMLVGVAAVTSVIATFLPVWRAARRKPVESIRAL